MNYRQYDTLTINGLPLKGEEIIRYCENSDQDNLRQLGKFMEEWMKNDDFIWLKTSGSTGAPKEIIVEKKQMLSSASMTALFFGFEEGQTALLCLPMRYIAGKMMVVRALYSRLNLLCVEPGPSPVTSVSDSTVIDFVPLVPMQLLGVNSTKKIRKILLGGSAISPSMEEAFQSLQAEIFEGYGMTETLSHIALRRVNGAGKSDVYRALPGVHIETDERGCLIADVSFLNHLVYTNDVVDLKSDKEFIWRGRYDNVINSGGIKFFPEEIEKKLASVIHDRFFIAGLPDERFGEKLCLLVEGDEYPKERYDTLLSDITRHLQKYEKPRDIFFIKNFKTTASGKIIRGQTVECIGK